ncbi:uncharacterized protein LOC131239181 isoform X2 [Magnolia sinica]|uniref:uncharacterized protein LOC131239181 isoform X2 n=1 Tax=Magnolia sinica TaxID=86752 RepID=UPI0026590B41|nr:uncharacterized protein LOC131239181 isoform X2 [Magnolia sinica]
MQWSCQIHPSRGASGLKHSYGNNWIKVNSSWKKQKGPPHYFCSSSTISQADTKVIVLANLKPRNMRGVKSNGMLMAASDASHENVELLLPPEGSIPGERIWFGSEDEKEKQLNAATPNQVQKKKIWESIQPHLKTTDSCVAVLGGHPMRTSAGVVVCRSLKNANIS